MIRIKLPRQRRAERARPTRDDTRIIPLSAKWIVSDGAEILRAFLEAFDAASQAIDAALAPGEQDEPLNKKLQMLANRQLWPIDDIEIWWAALRIRVGVLGKGWEPAEQQCRGFTRELTRIAARAGIRPVSEPPMAD